MLVHGANLRQKETNTGKYTDSGSKQLLSEIRTEYEKWNEANMKLVGPSYELSQDDEELIIKWVDLLNVYKDFIDQQVYAEHFDSRSNLHSTVLEEFLYYLFKDMVSDFSGIPLIGKSHAFKDLFFVPPNFREMLSKPHARIERKDHDFVIGIQIEAAMTTGSGITETHNFDIPAVAIECKTYLDKTMLEGSSTAAEQLKARNPNAIYVVIMEWIKLTNDVNLKKYKVDQIYVLRKQKNTDREYRFAPDYVKNPIYADTILNLFQTVHDHLKADWQGGIEFGLERGWLV